MKKKGKKKKPRHMFEQLYNGTLVKTNQMRDHLSLSFKNTFSDFPL